MVLPSVSTEALSSSKFISLQSTTLVLFSKKNNYINVGYNPIIINHLHRINFTVLPSSLSRVPATRGPVNVVLNVKMCLRFLQLSLKKDMRPAL